MRKIMTIIKTHIQIRIFVTFSFEALEYIKVVNTTLRLALIVFVNGHTTSFPSASFPGRA